MRSTGERLFGAVLVVMTKLPGDVVVGRNGHVRVPVNGTVTRSNLGSAACQDNPREPEDCGVLPIRTGWSLDLQWRGKGFNLIAGLPGVDTDAFSNCASRLLLDPYPSLTGAEDTHFVVARVSTKDQARRLAAPSSAPAVIRAWPPWRSVHQPHGIEAMPVVRSPTVSAPLRSAGDQPSSASIGAMNRAKAK